MLPPDRLETVPPVARSTPALVLPTIRPWLVTVEAIVPSVFTP